jgi:hypothetical protein
VALDEGEYAPLPAVKFGDPPVDVGPLYVPTEDYAVHSVFQAQRFPPDGRIIPDITIGFTVPGLAGSYTIRVDNYAFTHADVLGYLRQRADQLRAIYDLAT